MFWEYCKNCAEAHCGLWCARGIKAEAEAALAEADKQVCAELAEAQKDFDEQLNLKVEKMKEIDRLQAKLAANEDKRIDLVLEVDTLREKLAGSKDETAELLRQIDRLTAKRAAAEAHGLKMWEDGVVAANKQDAERCARITALEAEVVRLKKNIADSGIFCRDECSTGKEIARLKVWRCDKERCATRQWYQPSRPPADCKTCKSLHSDDCATCKPKRPPADVVRVKEYFYTTGMDISGKRWHKVRAHTRRKPKRRRSK